METIRVTVRKRNGGTKVFSGHDNRMNHLWMRKDRKEINVSQDAETQEIVITEHEVDGAFIGGESHHEKVTRFPMADVESFTIEDHGSSTYMSETYEKRTYIDQMGIERTRFVLVGSRRSG